MQPLDPKEYVFVKYQNKLWSLCVLKKRDEQLQQEIIELKVQ
jgi:hypothetical protein